MLPLETYKHTQTEAHSVCRTFTNNISYTVGKYRHLMVGDHTSYCLSHCCSVCHLQTIYTSVLEPSRTRVAKRWHRYFKYGMIPQCIMPLVIMMNAAPASNSPVLHCCIMTNLRECLDPGGSAWCLNAAALMHHDDQGHDEWRYHAVPKGLSTTASTFPISRL